MVSLQLHKWGGRGAAGAKIEAPRGWGMGMGCPLPRKIFDFGSQSGEFWCILVGIFYSSATCFTRNTGVIWCPFRFKKDLFRFLAFWRRQNRSTTPVQYCQAFRMHSAKASPLQHSAQVSIEITPYIVRRCTSGHCEMKIVIWRGTSSRMCSFLTMLFSSTSTSG